VHKCILSIYGFLLAPVRSDCAVEWKAHPAQHRIEVVRDMISTQNQCRRQLLSIADASDDDDLMEAGTGLEIFANCVWCLLRCFSKQTGFGFKDGDMADVVFCLCCNQSFGGCFLISTCNLVDLQIQQDLHLNETQKYECLDKSQVAHRIMSSTDSKAAGGTSRRRADKAPAC